MKRYIILFAGVFCIMLNAQAQNSKVVTAYNYLTDHEWLKAKEAIDLATLDAGTSVKPKTWVYRAQIYYGIGQDTTLVKKYPDAFATSLEAYKKALELDTKKDYTDDIQKGLMGLKAIFYNTGANKWRKQNYPDAYESFKNAVNVESSINTLNLITKNPIEYDTLMHYYTAAIAFEIPNYAAAKPIFEDLASKTLPTGPRYIDEKNGVNVGKNIYTSLVTIYESEKDTAKAMETIDKGIAKYPTAIDLVIDRLNIYLAEKQYDKAIEATQTALALNPPKPELFMFNAGLTYEKKYNFSEGLSVERLGDTALVAKSYRDALTANPNYFDAAYEYGAMYYNLAVVLYKKYMSKLGTTPADQAKYDKLAVVRDALFNKSLPLLEKARAIVDTEQSKGVSAEEVAKDKRSILTALKELYTRQNKDDKAKEMQAELDKLGK